MNPLPRLLRLLLVTSILALAAPAAAQASHLQGGYFTAGVDSAGHLKGTLTFLYDAGFCSVGTPETLQFTLNGPGGSQNIPVSAEVTRCLGTATTTSGSFDVDLSSQPDGAYTLTYTNSAWVGGIQNSPGNTMNFTAGVRKSALGATGAPNLSSEPSRGIAVGYPYSQNLNASDPDGGTLSYQSLVAPHTAAPSASIIDVSQTGQVTIPASTTTGFANGQKYVYKVRVTDSQGDWAERDVLLTVTDQNAPPSISGLATSYEVEAGKRTEIELSAPDPNSGDTVNVEATGLPAWAALQVTPGNPATMKLVVEPPAGSEGETAGINLDAFDDNSIAPLMGSANTVLTVAAAKPPAEPKPEPAPGPGPALKLPKLAVAEGSSGLAGVIEVIGNSATVGCAATDTLLGACAAEIRLRGSAAGTPGVTVSARQLIGRGRKAIKGASRARLRINLTRRGKRLVRRTLGGLPVRVTLRARTAGGQVLTAHRNARMRPERQLAVPTDGLFGVRGTDFGADGRRLLARVAARVKGAKRVTCIGHADGTATPEYGLALGAARARVVCAQLRRLGFRGRVRARSKGITQPRASNDTAEGRALNRRVELRIVW